MITKELVDRINFLARKQRSQGLNDDEKAEQKRLREQYLQGIREQVVGALESAGIQPKNKDHQEHHKKHQSNADQSCSCGHCHTHKSHPYKH